MQQEINNTLNVLNKGGLILYPTDTVWGIGCDATNFEAVKKIFSLKQREDTKTLICLVANIRMLEKYVYQVPEVAYQLLEIVNKPTTIIYDAPINVAPNLIAADNTLAIRIPHHDFCQELLKKFKRPLVSTSANISNQPTPQSFTEITPEILKGVDYVVNLHRNKKNGNPSTIIKLSNTGIVNIIRK